LNTLQWIFIIPISLGLAHATLFSGATQKLGRALSSTGIGNGFQDAITPP
jgi:hypothetical protein